MYGLPGQAPYNQAGVVGGHRIEIVCYTSRTSKGAIVQPVGRGWQRQDDACAVHALGQGGWVSTHWSGGSLDPGLRMRGDAASRPSGC